MKHFVLKNEKGMYYFEDFDVSGLTENIYEATIIQELEPMVENPGLHPYLDPYDIMRIEIEEKYLCKFKNIEIEIKEIE